jgi:AhpD family alkylhydroperoxidase
MAELNRDASELMVAHGAHACTDVTGFGLAGHLVEMARGSGTCAEIELERIPIFSAARCCLDKGVLPGAIERNEEYSMAWIQHECPEDESDLPILHDAQTSGGLLVALPAAAADSFIAEMHARGHSATAVIGRIAPAVAGRDGVVNVHGTRCTNVIGPEISATPRSIDTSAEASRHADDKEPMERIEMSNDEMASCCDPQPGDSGGPAIDPLAGFDEFMKQANMPGLIDKKNKKLMAIALSVSQGCRPCLVVHMKAAKAMGISKAEIDEAAALAISFAGCPALMLYREVASGLGLD